MYLFTNTKVLLNKRETLIVLFFICLNVLLFGLIGGYLESYEGLYSSICSGLYTDFAIVDYFQDFHTLLFAGYAFINKIFPSYNIYGIVLYVLNICSLLFFAFVLYQYFKEYILLFFICYVFFAVDSILNIASNRIVITFTVLCFITLINSGVGKVNHIIVFFVFTMCLLIKSEIVLLIAFVIISAAFFIGKLNRFFVIYFLYALVYFIVLQYLFAHYFTEERLAFLYYEFDFIDKSNIDYSKLTLLQTLDVQAFKNYNIVDSVHFTSEFYKSIQYDNFFFTKMNLLQSFSNTFILIKSTYEYVLLNIVLILILSYKKTSKYSIVLVYIFLFPILVSLIINIPERFIITYFSFLALVSLWLLLKDGGFEQQNYYIVLFLVVTGLILSKFPSKIRDYEATQFKVESFFHRLDTINRNDKPIVINNVEYMGRYFPTNPFYRLEHKNITFLNFWYLTSYNSYVLYWKNLCHCNPFSLRDKLNYIVNENIDFIVSLSEFKLLESYVYKKYNIRIKLDNLRKFDDTLYLATIKIQN